MADKQNSFRADDRSKRCCGGPAPENVDACCVRDAEAKAAGKSGCGCSAALDSSTAKSDQPACG